MDTTISKLGASAARHLVTIAELRSSRGYARVSDVARTLGITRGSASLTIKTLKQKGFVDEDENRFLLLTDEGQICANCVRGKRFLLHKLFREILGAPDEVARLDSAQMETFLSDENATRLASFLKLLESDDIIASKFRDVWAANQASCDGEPEACQACYEECYASAPTETSDMTEQL